RLVTASAVCRERKSSTPFFPDSTRRPTWLGLTRRLRSIAIWRAWNGCGPITPRRKQNAGCESNLIMNGLTGATIVNGMVLGWSVAWPPGPINAEMIRRGLQLQAGGFWAAWQLGLGACTGDFIWALGVAAGAGALLASPRFHLALGVISFLLLLCLALNFA